jgi:CO dehydrogenase/acetyl-CoA synthase beta subunit
MTHPYDALNQKLKKIQDTLEAIPGVHLHDIRNFINGQMSVNRKGDLKLPIVLPAGEVLPRPDDVGQVVRGEWKVVPLLMFVEPDA